MSANQNPEPGWPQWAGTPAERERNQQHQARRNERIQAERAAFIGPETWASWAGIETDNSELGEAGEPDGISIP